MRGVPWIAKRSLMLAGCSVLVLCQAGTGTVQAPKPFLFPGSLIVSSSIYGYSQGNLTAGQTQLAGASTLPTNEAFSVLGAPTYGTVYRGVVYVTPTWQVKGPG